VGAVHATTAKTICSNALFFFRGGSNGDEMSRPTNGPICRSVSISSRPPIQMDVEYLKLSIKIRIFSNNLGWINDQNKSCRSRKVMKLCYLQLFHLKSFTALKYYLKLKFEIIEEL
jgi:hypothetical protein